MTRIRAHLTHCLYLAAIMIGLALPKGVSAQRLGTDTVQIAMYADEIYEEYRKLKEYQLAYAPWRFAMDHSSIRRVKHYTDGIEIISALMEDSTLTAPMKQTYVDELMALYDNWIAHADSLNQVIDKPYTKTYIRVLKAIDYRNHYNDSIQYPYWRKAYIYIKEAIEEPGDDIANYDYNLLYHFYRYSLRLYAESQSEFAEQFQSDYDLVSAKIGDVISKMSQLDMEADRISTAQSMLDQTIESFATNFRGTGNCEQDEATFMAQMDENFMDEKFLKKVIVTMQYCDSSEVFVEALQNYLRYIDPFHVTYAKLLADKYYRRGEYSLCLKYYAIAEEGEEDMLKKANIQYNMSVIYRNQKDLAKASRYVKRAIKSNPDYGDAYIQLALIYGDASIHWNREPMVDRYKFLLCIDKCEEARRCIKKAQGDPSLRAYNRTDESYINKLIENYKQNAPTQGDVFFLPNQYRSGKLNFNAGLLKGESTTIRFFQ